MSNKNTNLRVSQVQRVERRARLIEEAIKLTKGSDFSSFNAYATALTDTLTKFEFMEAKIQCKNIGENQKFFPPKPASRQIFYRNKKYRELAEAGFALQRVSGAAAIKHPRTPIEFKVILDQKDFEISNLKAELSRLKEKNKHIEKYISSENNLEPSNDQIKKLKQENSKTLQALIKTLRWADGLLILKDGKILDLGAIGKSATVVESKLLKHCSHFIDEALDGFSTK